MVVVSEGWKTKGEQAGVLLSAPANVEDMGEGSSLGTRSVPPERRRKNTISVYRNKIKTILTMY